MSPETKIMREKQGDNITETHFSEIQKYKLQEYRNLNYKCSKIQVTEIQK